MSWMSGCLRLRTLADVALNFRKWRNVLVLADEPSGNFPPNRDVERSIAVQSEPMRRPARARHVQTFAVLLQSGR
ncbi:hypothetical protein CIT26_14115 [Mesorhizobium temperatum]|uniref:Uncharacterized protein n=1 Tax=Mesorhizobium temperatum TaxID=241416 RepID=A0A271LLR0_9HYPH|nr:hypothetical protein CIT26_14115 [Mesorhizobium temperatum]